VKGLRILVIEDEPGIVRMLEPTLRAAGADVTVAWNGSQGLDRLAEGGCDLVLCDLGLPDMDGQELVGAIRTASDVPVIVLSAREHERDKVKALDAGADDFVSKPFSVVELLARMRAATRRTAPSQTPCGLTYGELLVDLDRRRAVLFGEEIRLSAREHALLTLLAQAPRGVATHRQIIERVWGADASAETQSVRVLVGQLRQKLEKDPSSPRILCTEPGVGYRLCSGS
jgi:two-component system KDP operon response regulator KdpE